MTGSKATVMESEAASRAHAGRERRRQPRIKIVQPVRLRGKILTGGELEEVRSTVNVSEGGIYFTTASDAYSKGMQIWITLPYDPSAAATPPPERLAEVVRITLLPDGQRGIGVHFLEPGAGETVHPAHASRARKSSAPADAGPRLLVLGVDGDRRTLNLLLNSLEPYGYEVRTAATGEEGLEELRRAVPALLFVEIDAPGLSGHDLCHIIKRDERLAKIPLVLMTSRGSVADYSIARELGAVICMPKPCKAERLVQVAHLLAPVPANGKQANA